MSFDNIFMLAKYFTFLGLCTAVPVSISLSVILSLVERKVSLRRLGWILSSFWGRSCDDELSPFLKRSNPINPMSAGHKVRLRICDQRWPFKTGTWLYWRLCTYFFAQVQTVDLLPGQSDVFLLSFPNAKVPFFRVRIRLDFLHQLRKDCFLCFRDFHDIG